MADPLPCPFCGSTDLRHEFAGSQGFIECNECGAFGPCDERAADPICDYDAAWEAWNRRAALADGPAVPESREPASVASEATGQPRPLSPAAQAVLTAANGASSYGPDDCLNEAPQIALATILALADQVAPMPDEADQERIPDGADRQESIRLRILRIAAELEGRHG